MATLTDTLTRKLRREIAAGKWKAEQALPSERALAVRFDVSRVTARRSLQALCREGVVVARSGRGYFTVGGAADGAAQRRGVIYLYAASDGAPALDSMHASIINGANAECIARGLQLYAVSRSPVDVLEGLGGVWDHNLRGLLLDWATVSLAEQLFRRGIPFVVVEDDITSVPAGCVVQDDAGGTVRALSHMAAKGHRRLGILVNDRDNVHPRRRLAAYRGFLVERDLPAMEHWIAQVPDGAGAAGMAGLLDGPCPPGAVFVADRGLLEGALRELARRGLRCPGRSRWSCGATPAWSRRMRPCRILPT